MLNVLTMPTPAYQGFAAENPPNDVRVPALASRVGRLDALSVKPGSDSSQCFPGYVTACHLPDYLGGNRVMLENLDPPGSGNPVTVRAAAYETSLSLKAAMLGKR